MGALQILYYIKLPYTLGVITAREYVRYVWRLC